MPDKDGDEGKSTKSVVNKRQKQMMGEEGYDIARDQGRVRPSKDKKDATTMPQSKKSKRKEVKGDTPMQKEFKKKYGKKATALDAVKQEYKGQIMKVEELDLTQVAEAFGGYIVEQEKIESANRQAGDPKKREERAKKQKAFAAQMRRLDAKEGDRPEKVQQQMAKSSIEDDPRERGVSSRPKATSGAYLNPDGTLRVDPTPSAVDPDSPDQPDDGTVAPTIGKMRVSNIKDLPPNTDLSKPFPKPKPKKEPRPARSRKSTATPPAFATRTGESGGPLPVSMRNRRVPKTSSIVKPTVGALAKTDQETSAITKGGIDYKALQDKIKTVSLGKGLEIVDEPPKTRTQGGALGVDTGRTVTVPATEVKPDQLTGSKPRTMPQLMPAEPSMLDKLLDRTRKNRTKTDTKTDTETKLLPPSSNPDLTKLLEPKKKKFPINPQSFRKEPEPETQTEPEGGGGDGGKNNIVGTGTGDGGKKKPSAFSRIRQFARKDPVAALAAYDIGKGILGKIMKARVPNVPTPRAIRVSAKS